MAIPKVIGIETEYGIMVRGAAEWNPISASSTLINAYSRSLNQDSTNAVAWDFVDESPANDARQSAPLRAAQAPIVETHLVNAVLTNGARYYVDHAHPEMSTPECRDALSAVVYDRAGELILIDSMNAATQQSLTGETFVVYKDNSDRKGNAYGTHENYLLDRALPFSDVVRVATAHFISRQVFTGSGKVGSEQPGNTAKGIYQLTQRADHFEEPVGLETTLKRPIVNTRDEPHADARRYRRQHVIVGDANMCQVATFLKVGTTAIVFAMAEDGLLDGVEAIREPVVTLQAVSRSLALDAVIELQSGKTTTALGLQWDLLEKAQMWSDQYGLESVGETSGKLVLERWEQTLSALESDPTSLVGQIDWVTKKYLLEGYMERHGCDWSDPRVAALDLQYHDLRPDKCLALKANPEVLVDDATLELAKVNPPEDTRAFFRGEVLKRFSSQVVAANWDSIVFDTGEESLQRVPMMDPTKGTKSMVGALLDEVNSASELVARLSN